MRFSTAASTAALAVFASSAVACGPAGMHGQPGNVMMRRASSAAAASSTGTPTEESEAKITDSTQECTYYYIPEVSNMLSSYPTIWQTAEIPSNDTAANDLYNSIKSSIPSDVKPKGTREGDFTSVSYDASDPDCWWTYGSNGNKCDIPKHSGIPADVTVCNEPKTWGYTFDDGPNCTHNAFYDWLLEKKQKATMFYIGSNVMDWPLQAQRGLVDGHHLCSHTWSHPYMTALSDTEVFAELYYSAKAIKDITGVTVDCWRPPYGDIDDRVRAIATGLGLKSVLWTADTDDWEIQPAGTLTKADIEKNYATIIDNVSSTIGNIVLTHEINQYTMDIAMEQYANITDKFDHVVPLTACMNWTSPYAEDITYPNFADYVKGNIEPSGVPSSISFSTAAFSPVDGGGSSAVAQAASTGTSVSGEKASSQSSSSAAVAFAKPAAAVLVGTLIGAALVVA